MSVSNVASERTRCLKAATTEAIKVLCCPLCSSCCRENRVKQKLSFTDNFLAGFQRETGGQSSKGPLSFLDEGGLKRGCIFLWKWICITCNSNLRKEFYCASDIFAPPQYVYVGSFVSSPFVCEHLSA